MQSDGGTNGVWESKASVTDLLSPENLQECRDLKPVRGRERERESQPQDVLSQGLCAG